MKGYPKEFLEEQRKLLAQPPQEKAYEPLTKYDLPTEEALIAGKELLRKGKVACLVLAGGVGSRLATKGPKALVPVTNVRNKTFLQLLCEKIKAASHAYGTSLQIALMTSSSNHDEIKNYLVTNNYFGLSEADVHQFIQDNAPLLDEHGDWFHDDKGQLVVGPDGNGHCLKKLMETGIGKQWRKQGIEYVMLIPIDNPLADPFDASFCGLHFMKKNDLTIKAIFRTDPLEKLSIIATENHKIRVIEYFDLPPHIHAPLANSGMYCFNLAFIERIAHIDLPWHIARKKQAGKNVYKFERFIIDVLPLAEKCSVVAYPREDVFTPLKNEAGPDSLLTVREALLNFDRKTFSSITKTPAPSHTFELDPAFYYPTAELRAKWQGKKAPNTDYISP